MRIGCVIEDVGARGRQQVEMCTQLFDVAAESTAAVRELDALGPVLVSSHESLGLPPVDI